MSNATLTGIHSAREDDRSALLNEDWLAKLAAVCALSVFHGVTPPLAR